VNQIWTKLIKHLLEKEGKHSRRKMTSSKFLEIFIPSPQVSSRITRYTARPWWITPVILAI
jgi:hypothetical protein